MNAQLEEDLLEEPDLVAAADRGSDSLSGTRKAAMLLISLGDQASAKIVSQLSEDEIQRVSKAVACARSRKCSTGSIPA
jgi:flagellar motor switch protein FliG